MHRFHYDVQKQRTAVSLLPSILWYRNAYVMDVEGGDIQHVFRARLTLINQDAAKTLANTSARLECPRFDRRRQREKKKRDGVHSFSNCTIYYELYNYEK